MLFNTEHKQLMILGLLTLLALLSPTDASATVRYVNAGAPGANNGNSWADAYADLQAALAAAQQGDELWVAAGTYKPTNGTNRDLSFIMKTGVGIYGGFAGSETDRTQRNFNGNITILSGAI